MKKSLKILISLLLVILSLLLIFVPWKAENKGISYFIGYSFIWKQPAVYTDASFERPRESDKLINELDNMVIEDQKDKVRSAGYQIYPSWVKHFMRIDYRRIGLSCLSAIFMFSAFAIVLTLVRRKQPK